MSTVIDDLIRLAGALDDLRFVQGPGGNVSIKQDGDLLIKASGRRFADIGHRDDAVATVPLTTAELALAGDAEAERAVFERSPRPSLETFMHAFSGRVVAHTHSVGSLLFACADLDAPLPFGAEEVPYARPGRLLADAMRPIAEAPAEPAVLLLRCHGLLVRGEDVEEVVRVTEAVDSAGLALFPDAPHPSERLRAYQREPVREVAGGVVRLLPDRPATIGRYLFPDMVVYASHLPASLADVQTAAEEVLGESARSHVLWDAGGARALVARSRGKLDDALEVVAVHDWVEDVLAGRSLRFLADDEPAEILGMPSEQYRINLERERGT